MEPGTSRAALDPDSPERYVRLRSELGVTAFGINQMVLQRGQRGRIHRHLRQEEVYLVLEGELTVEIESEPETLAEGQLMRVAPEIRRRLSNRGAGRCVFLALGGAGEHEGRDGEAFADWEEETGRPPQETPIPADLEI